MGSAATGSVHTKFASIDLTRLVLFLDFDGTLVPLAKRPEAVGMSQASVRILDRLGYRLPVVVVSGRSVADLRRVIGLRHLHYIGLHGFSYAAPGKPLLWLAARPSRRVVRTWKEALEAVAGKVRGAWVEDKGISVALHDRQVAAHDRHRLRRRAVGVLGDRFHGKQIRLLRGKHVLEVLPAVNCDKGTAVSRILHESWARSRIPVYLGDDVTDLPALKLVGRSGVAIQIGSIPHAPKTCARLMNTRAVQHVLHDLADRLDRMSARPAVAPVRPRS